MSRPGRGFMTRQSRCLCSVRSRRNHARHRALHLPSLLLDARAVCLPGICSLRRRRGKGVGRALIEAVACRGESGGRLARAWLTHETNIKQWCFTTTSPTVAASTVPEDFAVAGFPFVVTRRTTTAIQDNAFMVRPAHHERHRSALEDMSRFPAPPSAPIVKNRWRCWRTSAPLHWRISSVRVVPSEHHRRQTTGFAHRPK